MSLADIVQLSITLKSTTVTKAGFGRPLICGNHSRFVGRTRLYTTADAMLVDGFLTTDQEYELANEVKSQRPAPKDFKIGRLALPFTQLVQLVPSNVTQGFVYSGTINGAAWSYTVLAAATTATVCTALAALFSGLSGTGMTFTGASGTWVLCTATTAGKVTNFVDMVPELRVTSTTADGGMAADMAAILAADTDWFGLLLTENSSAIVAATAAWVESKRRIFFYPSADYGCKDGASTTDIMYANKAFSYFNTAGFYHHEVGSLIAAGIMGSFLVTLPGTSSVAHKSIPGVKPSDVAANGTQYLTDAEDTNVQAKNGNTYRTIAGNGDVLFGKVASGDYIDAVRFIHFMYARITESVILALQSSPRIPYSDAGIEQVKGAILAPLVSWTRKPYEALSNALNEAPFVDAPKAADVDSASRIGRILPNVTFSARYLGAIHIAQITGTVSL